MFFFCKGVSRPIFEAVPGVLLVILLAILLPTKSPLVYGVFWISLFKAALMHLHNSCRNYSRSLVMTNHISNLIKQSFPEICRNDRSLNETIWTLKCGKSLLIEYLLIEQKFVNWTSSLQATRFLKQKLFILHV